jgi:hypothetical protein
MGVHTFKPLFISFGAVFPSPAVYLASWVGTVCADSAGLYSCMWNKLIASRLRTSAATRRAIAAQPEGFPGHKQEKLFSPEIAPYVHFKN